MPSHLTLLNSGTLEALPAALAKPRGNATARVLAQGAWLIRRKRDGKFLAVASRERIVRLQRDAIAPRDFSDFAELFDNAMRKVHARPLDGLHHRLNQLGLDAEGYRARSGLDLIAEPSRLCFSGFDRYRRPLWLAYGASDAWARMQAGANADGIVLEAVSGYRSHAYQLGIFQRKLARGLALEAILQVNAAPGFSEHHGGCALDVSSPGEPAAEESFEQSPAFHWLTHHAKGFGFHMSYPRGNPHGIVYEPWHWRWDASR